MTRIITLDAYEGLSQLCAIVSLVKLMPGSKTLLSAITTIEDGFIRLWRDWLNSEVQRRKNAVLMYGEEEGEEDEETNPERYHMFWVDIGRSVGLKISVKEKRDAFNAPLLFHPDEEAASYELEISGKIFPLFFFFFFFAIFLANKQL